MKTAFIFSALTGLRFSDVQALTWEKINYDELNGYSIIYTQKKTKGAENLPVPEQAIKMLGDRKNDKDLVFDGLEYGADKNKQLANWVKKAGINHILLNEKVFLHFKIIVLFDFWNRNNSFIILKIKSYNNQIICNLVAGKTLDIDLIFN